eukprot:4160615-Pleurochrysis_carterae.AAC.1
MIDVQHVSQALPFPLSAATSFMICATAQALMRQLTLAAPCRLLPAVRQSRASRLARYDLGQPVSAVRSPPKRQRAR